MKESFVILANYQGKEYGEVEELVARAKYRIEEWMEHNVDLSEIEIIHIENHLVTRYPVKEFLSKF
ncbi:MAG: hypothetical protein KAX49_06140 [Halanaerobiales bacterium]|nr:hypothetical protein [Halanaerobiales bacterium]